MSEIKSYFTLMCLIFLTLAFGSNTFAADKGVCAIGMELGPGDSCTYYGTTDTLSVGDDGIASFMGTSAKPDPTGHTHGGGVRHDHDGYVSHATSGELHTHASNVIQAHSHPRDQAQGTHDGREIHGGNHSHTHRFDTVYRHLEVDGKLTARSLEDGSDRYRITSLGATAPDTRTGNTGTGDTGTGGTETGTETTTGDTGTETETGTESDAATLREPEALTRSDQLSAAGQISFSELMITSRGGLRSLPQWIELYNNSDTETVNLRNWRLTVEVRDTDGTHRHAVIRLQELIIPPNETALIVTWSGRHSDEIQDSRIYNFVSHHSGDFEQNEHRNMVLGFKGFFLKLADPNGDVSDTVGNIDGDPGTEDKPLWEIPAGTTEDGERTSLLRRYAKGTDNPLDGTDADNWRRAANFGRVGDLSALAVSRYYGRNTDIGNPGYKGAGALPVALSSFRAVLKETGVLLSWTTESELENAGFNILRSVSKNGHFLKVNPRLIQGAGTTSERNTYTWTDTTAKPTTVYFYQIEDISYSGERTRFAAIRMKGYVSAQDKLATRWADLKNRE